MSLYTKYKSDRGANLHWNLEFIPKLCFLYLISLPYALKLINILNSYHYNPKALKDCKFIALKFQTMNGFGLIIGLLFNSFL